MYYLFMIYKNWKPYLHLSQTTFFQPTGHITQTNHGKKYELDSCLLKITFLTELHSNIITIDFFILNQFLKICILFPAIMYLKFLFKSVANLIYYQKFFVFHLKLKPTGPIFYLWKESYCWRKSVELKISLFSFLLI